MDKKKFTYTAVILARLGSKRFPGKVLKPLGLHDSIIQFIIERIRGTHIDNIVVAIPDNDINNELEDKCKEFTGDFKDVTISYYRGDEDNVLLRLLEAAEEIPTKKKNIILDITADCPFVCPRTINEMIEKFEQYKPDYMSNVMTRSWPDGFDVQLYTEEVLESLYSLSLSQFILPIHHSHTGWNIMNYSGMLCQVMGKPLKMMNYPSWKFYPDWAVTLDTKQDYKLICKINEILSKQFYNQYTAMDIIRLLEERPELLKINSQIIRNIPGVGENNGLKKADI